MDSAAPAQPRSAPRRYVCAQRQGSRGTGARTARALLCAALAPGARRLPPRLRSAAALLSASPQPVRGEAAAPSRGGFAPCRSRLRLFAGSPPPPLCPLCSLLWGQAGASARALRASMPPKGKPLPSLTHPPPALEGGGAERAPACLFPVTVI